MTRTLPTLATLLFASTLRAAAAADAPLTAQSRATVLDAIVDRLKSTYVDIDAAPRIEKALRTRQQSGAYDALSNPAQFAEVVTQDLRSINGDLHLNLHYSNEPPPAPGRGGVGPFSDPRSLNFGMGRAEILDGNVGYLEITGFTGGDYQGAVVDALRFLSRTDATILDVRRNPGGASDMSHFIFSHFLPEKPVPTINVFSRSSSAPTRRMSLGDVPGPRRTDVPLFVLTSQGTASAAEEFSFVLKNKHRATIVGTRTAGAGHMVAQIPIGSGFTVSLSITRVTDPDSGREWEQVGVQPDLAVAPEQALGAAHLAALKVIAASTSDTARAHLLQLLIETVEARAHVAPGAPARLASLSGVYGGRVVSVRDGRLWYARRNGALSEPLVSLSGDLYALGSMRLRFTTVGGRTTLTLEPADGTKIALGRDSAPPA
ncbi:MAG: S41 family peptidase [Vicinamibacteria bacterium]